MKVVQSILCVLSIIVIYFLIDLFCIWYTGKPVIYLKKEQADYHILYKSLVYDVYNCNSPNVVMGTFIVKKKEKFECKSITLEEAKKLKVISIVDQTKENKDFVCNDNKEVLFEDDENVYYFECPKSDFVIVEYDDGSKDTIKSAINKGLVNLTILNEFEISFKSESKNDDKITEE